MRVSFRGCPLLAVPLTLRSALVLTLYRIWCFGFSFNSVHSPSPFNTSFYWFKLARILCREKLRTLRVLERRLALWVGQGESTGLNTFGESLSYCHWSGISLSTSTKSLRHKGHSKSISFNCGDSLVMTHTIPFCDCLGKCCCKWRFPSQLYSCYLR